MIIKIKSHDKKTFLLLIAYLIVLNIVIPSIDPNKWGEHYLIGFDSNYSIAKHLLGVFFFSNCA